MSKVVENPCLNRIESTKKFTAHLKQYNAVQDKLSQKLRDTHLSLFNKILELQDALFRDLNKQSPDYQINLDLGVKLSVSSYILAKFINCAPSTIRLRINRLRDAGVILRVINHGKLRPVDLILNPRFLEIQPISEFFANISKTPTYAPLRLNSAEVCSSQEQVNNKIMLRDAESEDDAKAIVVNLMQRLDQLQPQQPYNANQPHSTSNIGSSSDEGVLLRENAQEQNHFSQEHGAMPQGGSGLTGYKQKLQQQEQDFRARIIIFSALFLSLAIDKFKFWCSRKDGLSLFDVDRQPLIEKIANTYFSKCQTDKDLSRVLNIYTARFEMVASYRRRKKWDLQWPDQYFDVNNPTGFAATALWYKNARENRDRKELTKQKLTNNDRLLNAIKRLTKDPSRKMFERSYIFNKCPQLLPQFDEMVAQLARTALKKTA